MLAIFRQALHGRDQSRRVHPAMRRRVSTQATPQPLRLPGIPIRVGALMVQAGGRGMHQPLEKIPLLLRGTVPSLLPRLVTVKEPARIEQPGPLQKQRLQSLILQQHAPALGDPVAGALGIHRPARNPRSSRDHGFSHSEWPEKPPRTDAGHNGYADQTTLPTGTA